MFARVSDQVAAQLAAQSTALTSVMQRFETLHPATPPSRSRRPERQPTSESRPSSRRASPSSQRPPHRQSVLDAGALQGVCLCSTARPLAMDPRVTGHQLAPSARIASPVPLGAAQQSHQLAPFPLAPYPLASPAPSALPAPSSNPAESPQSGLLLAPLALPPLCRIASFASTVRSSVLTERTARREYCGGAGCAATGHHIGAVRTRAASVRGCCRAACASSRSAAQYGRSTLASRSAVRNVCSTSASRSAARYGRSTLSKRSAVRNGRSTCSSQSAVSRRRSISLASGSAVRCVRSTRDASRSATWSARRRLKKKTQTRCSRSRVARVSASQPATRSEDLLPNSSCTFACVRARCTTGGTFSWPRSARKRLKKSGARTSQIPSQTTQNSRAMLKRCLASSNSKGRSARSYARTLKPALRPSLPTLHAQRTCARRPTPHSRRKHSFRSLWTTSSRGLPIPQREIICCTTTRAARSPGNKSCRWRKHAKRRTSYCTHPRLPLQLQVRRSPRPQPLRVRVRTMR